MTHEPMTQGSETALAVRVREEADLLLAGLLEERARSEARFRQSGRRDPLKALTGTSALDQAITTTGQMLEHLDALIGELQAELTATSATLQATAAS